MWNGLKYLVLTSHERVQPFDVHNMHTKHGAEAPNWLYAWQLFVFPSGPTTNWPVQSKTREDLRDLHLSSSRASISTRVSWVAAENEPLQQLLPVFVREGRGQTPHIHRQPSLHSSVISEQRTWWRNIAEPADDKPSWRRSAGATKRSPINGKAQSARRLRGAVILLGYAIKGSVIGGHSPSCEVTSPRRWRRRRRLLGHWLGRSRWTWGGRNVVPVLQ